MQPQKLKSKRRSRQQEVLAHDPDGDCMFCVCSKLTPHCPMAWLRTSIHQWRLLLHIPQQFPCHRAIRQQLAVVHCKLPVHSLCCQLQRPPFVFAVKYMANQHAFAMPAILTDPAHGQHAAGTPSIRPGGWLAVVLALMCICGMCVCWWPADGRRLQVSLTCTCVLVLCTCVLVSQGAVDS